MYGAHSSVLIQFWPANSSLFRATVSKQYAKSTGWLSLRFHPSSLSHFAFVPVFVSCYSFHSYLPLSTPHPNRRPSYIQKRLLTVETLPFSREHCLSTGEDRTELKKEKNCNSHAGNKFGSVPQKAATKGSCYIKSPICKNDATEYWKRITCLSELQ